MLEKRIMECLKQVREPETGQDLISANRIKDITADDQNIRITLMLPGLQVKYKDLLYQACYDAVSQVFPHHEVHVHFEVAGVNAKSNQTTVPQIKHIIAIASGKGGVGKSTVAVNLALALKKQGLSVGLMDADLYGPSVPMMLGVQGHRPKVEQIMGEAKIVPLLAQGMPVMSIGFIIEPEQAVVLRGPRLAGIIKQFLTDCLWPTLDVLVIDLPPGTGDIQLTLVQTVPVSGAVMVTTPQNVAVADAVKAANMFLLPNVNVPILGVIENMSWFTPAELPDKKYFIFGQGGGNQLAHFCNTNVLAQIPLVQKVREGGDLGKPVVGHNEDVADYFISAAKKLWAQLELRQSTLPPTQRVNIQM